MNDQPSNLAEQSLPMDLTLKFWPMSCAKCGVSYLILLELFIHRVRDGGTIFCPNGHECGATLEGHVLRFLTDRLCAELGAARLELSRLRIIRGRAIAADPDPKKAMRLRARELAASADVVQSLRKPGGRKCPLCSCISRNE